MHRRPALVALAAALCAPLASAQDTVSIPEIQGAGHVSPFVGERVVTSGVVTAVAGNGVYVQDPEGDRDETTSDGLFVFTDEALSPGDTVRLMGDVSEFVPGGSDTGNLSITQLFRPEVEVLSAGAALPRPARIGLRGRIPPARAVISDDELGRTPLDLREALDDAMNTFDPDEDGIDFYESLEGMRVTVRRPVAVSATRAFGSAAAEFVVLPNGGRLVAPGDARNRRGGIDLQPDPDNRGDQNPERVQIQIDGTLYPEETLPSVTVGDRLDDVTGVVGYSFGNFEVLATEALEVRRRFLPFEVTRLSGRRNAVTVASYNVLNLSPDASDEAQRVTLARQIAFNLRAPDIVALQEIQDNSGETDDGTIDASETLQALVDAIAAAGGPDYDFAEIAPADGSGGGVPGGNIRNAFLYDASRVSLEALESLDSGALSDIGVADPDAFEGTRKPLVGTFSFNGIAFDVVNVHLSSRFGSTPIFGAIQPFVQAAEEDREAQVAALNAVVDAKLANDRRARVVVLGDFNTFEFTDDLVSILPGPERVLENLIETLRDDKVYTFNFEGNSQVLDHAFVTRALAGRGTRVDIVHVNVDYPRIEEGVGSDHEPLVVRLRLRGGRAH